MSKLPAPYLEKPCEDLFYKMKKIEGLSYSIHLLKEQWRKHREAKKAGRTPPDAPTMYNALELQHLEQQRKELWGLLPPIRKVVDNT